MQRVIEHAKITLWAADRNKKLVLFKGHIGTQSNQESNVAMLGKNLEDVLSEMHSTDLDQWNWVIQEVLRENPQDEVFERVISHERCYRTRLVPLWQTRQNSCAENDAYIDGVVGMSMDITELRQKEKQLEEQEEENARLVANAVAAKEASRSKSQLLANMSHEIRTPIAGVIGMSELPLQTDLGNEQQGYAQNIRRAANNLLTMINDILDFSKVESGRLDVEEVPFDVSVVLKDTIEMVAFAAHQKNLAFDSFI